MSILDKANEAICKECEGYGGRFVYGGVDSPTYYRCTLCYSGRIDGWILERADPTTGVYSTTAFHESGSQDCETLSDNIADIIALVYIPRDNYRDIATVERFTCSCGAHCDVVSWDVIMDASDILWNEPIPPFRNHADDVYDDVTDVARLRRDYGV